MFADIYVMFGQQTVSLPSGVVGSARLTLNQ